ncbi:Glutaminase [Cedecea neteri]|uniref:glutaminase n=1 Tax=Cedecea neteri TaxID=158822 RepID=A0A2X3KXJ5_9ENTR|nr:Glutaminase [Cedecea neteri]
MSKVNPRNPFINAGALVVCDMLQTRLSAPKQRMLEVVRALSGADDLVYNTRVARSEFEHSARNAAIAWPDEVHLVILRTMSLRCCKPISITVHWK